MTVRKAEKKDAVAIARLEKECFSHPWSEKALEEELENPNSVLFAAEQDGEVVGYAGVQVAADEGYILNVAVTGRCRRQGTGQKLIREMIAFAGERKLAFLTLELRRSNLPAEALYSKNGFETVGCRRGYYDDPKEDAVLMTLFFGEKR